jgi:ribonuclease HI
MFKNYPLSKVAAWDFPQQLLDKLEEDDFLEAMTVSRLIWMRRNTLVFEGSFTPPAILLGHTKI